MRRVGSSLYNVTSLTNNNDRLHLLDILVVKFVEEEEEKTDNDESDSKADNEEDKLLVTLYSILYIQSHSVLSSTNKIKIVWGSLRNNGDQNLTENDYLTLLYARKYNELYFLISLIDIHLKGTSSIESGLH